MQNHIFAITLAATGLIGSASWAECGKLCNSGWLKSATLTELQAEVDGGADVNAQSKNGLTPLHQAPTVEIFRVLLSAGADINVRNEYGATPLHSARTREIVQTLLEGGADIDVRNEYGRTPLSLAFEPDVVFERNHQKSFNYF